MPTIKISRLKRPARKRQQYQPTTRRESWEWPDPEKHPEVGIYWVEQRQAYRATVIKNYKLTVASFPVNRYSSRGAALTAAIRWRRRMKDPNAPSYGRKLDLARAGFVAPEYRDGRLVAWRASLMHDSVRLQRAFGAQRNPAQARADAELALQCFREEMRHYTHLTAAQQRALRWA